MWRLYDVGTTGNANPYYDTAVGTDEWVPSIAGFFAMGGDIQESGAVNPIYLEVIDDDGAGHTFTTWHIRCDVASHGFHESWRVRVLYVRKNLIEM